MSAKRRQHKNTLTKNRRHRCPGPQTRRDFLKVGVISGLGLSLGDYFHLQAAHADATVAQPAAQSVIFVFMQGGMSHLDTFDPKPYAPIEYRGELGTVKTKTGDVFSGPLPKLAAIADKITIIRSMSHTEAAHSRGTHNMLTGYRPSPAITYPSMGSVVAHEYGPRNELPPYVCIPGANETFLGTGYLSSAYGPFSVGGEPANDGFKVRDLNLPEGVTPERMEKRRNLLSEVDAHFAALEKSELLSAMDTYYQRAYALISSQSAREAFDIQAEPAEIRDEYGRHAFGQRLLLARRLVEAGGRFVTVTDGGWDNHLNIRDRMRNHLPSIDQGLAALVRDLDRRGLLESTLVVVTTEFGRTVRINKDGGRDHWSKAFSTMLAGGGVTPGVIYGKTDARGAEPTEHPVAPQDLAATLFTQLGIDPTRKLMSAGNRPIDIVRDGEPLRDLIA